MNGTPGAGPDGTPTASSVPTMGPAAPRRSSWEIAGMVTFGVGCLAVAVGLALAYVAVQDLARNNPLLFPRAFWDYQLVSDLAVGVGAVLVGLGVSVRWATVRSARDGPGVRIDGRTGTAIFSALLGGVAVAGGAFTAAWMAESALSGAHTQFPEWTDDLLDLTAGVGIALLAVAVLLRWGWATPRSSDGTS